VYTLQWQYPSQVYTSHQSWAVNRSPVTHQQPSYLFVFRQLKQSDEPMHFGRFERKLFVEGELRHRGLFRQPLIDIHASTAKKTKQNPSNPLLWLQNHWYFGKRQREKKKG